MNGLIFAIAGLGIAACLSLGKTAIETMGELVHFNCRPSNDRIVCELTREPLIGQLKTIQFEKEYLKSTTIQQRSNHTRLAIVLKSGEEISLTHHWSKSNHQQLLEQRELLDRFLADPTVTVLNVRTHRPGYLWAILAGLIGGIAGMIAIVLIAG